MSVVSYGNLLILFNVLCYQLACFEKGIKVVKEKETYLSTFFIDLEGWVSFAYVPVRDQNLVVRGKNWRLEGFVVCFFISFEKGFKVKESQSGKWVFVCVFYVERK